MLVLYWLWRVGKALIPANCTAWHLPSYCTGQCIRCSAWRISLTFVILWWQLVNTTSRERGYHLLVAHLARTFPYLFTPCPQYSMGLWSISCLHDKERFVICLSDPKESSWASSSETQRHWILSWNSRCFQLFILYLGRVHKQWKLQTVYINCTLDILSPGLVCVGRESNHTLEFLAWLPPVVPWNWLFLT